MEKQCPSCNQKYETELNSYEIAMIFGTPEEREYWLSGLCHDCQNYIFVKSF